MADLYTEIVGAVRTALTVGRSGIDAAARVWERHNGGLRHGLNNYLLELIDRGAVQGTVVAHSPGGSRKVTSLTSAASGRAEEPIVKSRNVFVVHGRDEEIRNAMFDFLRALDLRPMEFNELVATSGSASPYIGDVIDRAFEKAQAIVILLTPDEEVKLVPRLGGTDEGHQARPNVLFEAGLALGRIPNRTVIVEVGSLRPFSDIAGRHVVRLDDRAPNSVARRQDLANRLGEAGCDVSTTGVDWHSVGRFDVPTP